MWLRWGDVAGGRCGEVWRVDEVWRFCKWGWEVRRVWDVGRWGRWGR